MTTKLTFLLALCLVTGMLMIACGGAADNTATTNTATTNTATTNTATTNTATPPSTASADKVGVAECDDFIAKYEACISGKVPASAQATVKSSLDTWRKSWKDLAANPSTKGTLAAACKQAADTAKTSMSAYGCSW